MGLLSNFVVIGALNTSIFTSPVAAGMRPTPEFATCVDAPFGAREISKSGAARGRVLTCVRPLMRLTRGGPRWESGDQVPIRPTRLTRLSQSWFSRCRLSTVAPSLPFDLPTPDSLAVVTAPTPPQPELDNPHRAPAAPR